MTDAAKTSPPSPSSAVSPSVSPDALALRWAEPLTRALRGVEQRLDDLAGATSTERDMGRMREMSQRKAIERCADELATLKKRVGDVLELARVGTAIDSTRVEHEREQLERATATLARAADRVEEHTGQHALLPPEQLEDGPAPELVTRAASTLAVRLAHLLWPYAPVGVRHVLAWAATLLAVDGGLVAYVTHALTELFRAL